MSTHKIEKLSPMIVTDTDEGREYTLEFNRKAVSKAENAGLDINRMESATMTMLPIMFWAAFLMHHPHMTKEQTDKILFDGMGGLTDEEMEHLGKLYAAPYGALVRREDEAENPRRMAVKF